VRGSSTTEMECLKYISMHGPKHFPKLGHIPDYRLPAKLAVGGGLGHRGVLDAGALTVHPVA